MHDDTSFPLVAPRVTPALDPAFRPAALAVRAYEELARETPGSAPVRLALEQADGSAFHAATFVLPESLYQFGPCPEVTSNGSS